MVYDIDETIIDTKKIVLDTQDSASINIVLISYVLYAGETEYVTSSVKIPKSICVCIELTIKEYNASCNFLLS